MTGMPHLLWRSHVNRVKESCHPHKWVISPVEYERDTTTPSRAPGDELVVKCSFRICSLLCGEGVRTPIDWRLIRIDASNVSIIHTFTKTKSLYDSFKRILPKLCVREHLKHQSKPLTVFLRRTRVCSAHHVFPIQHVLHTMIQSWVHLAGPQSQMKSNYHIEMCVFLFYRSTNNDCAKEYNEYNSNSSSIHNLAYTCVFRMSAATCFCIGDRCPSSPASSAKLLRLVGLGLPRIYSPQTSSRNLSTHCTHTRSAHMITSQLII